MWEMPQKYQERVTVMLGQIAQLNILSVTMVQKVYLLQTLINLTKLKVIQYKIHDPYLKGGTLLGNFQGGD